MSIAWHVLCAYAREQRRHRLIAAKVGNIPEESRATVAARVLRAWHKHVIHFLLSRGLVRRITMMQLGRMVSTVWTAFLLLALTGIFAASRRNVYRGGSVTCSTASISSCIYVLAITWTHSSDFLVTSIFLMVAYNFIWMTIWKLHRTRRAWIMASMCGILYVVLVFWLRSSFIASVECFVGLSGNMSLWPLALKRYGLV